jgi:hypothetical protein
MLDQSMSRNLRRFLPAGLAALVLIAVFLPGSAREMIHRGWAIRSEPIADKPQLGEHHGWYHPGGQPPTAYKDQNGNLQVSYHVIIRQFGAHGSWDGGKEIEMERRTKLILKAKLKPAGKYNTLKDYTPTIGTVQLPPDSVVPFIGLKDGAFQYPHTECVLLLAGGWYWYVPPSSHGDVPQLAFVAGQEDYTPWYIYPIRVVCYPFYFVKDLIFVPFYYIARIFGWADSL